MDEDRTDLLVFIDLAFVLLVGFLILTETDPRMSVALPSKPVVESTSASGPTVYNLYFDGIGRFLVESGEGAVCNPDSLENLVLCMEQVATSEQTAVFVLIPQGGATVQRMVVILDTCYASEWSCTVTN